MDKKKNPKGHGGCQLWGTRGLKHPDQFFVNGKVTNWRAA
jgi:hypothetical protein